MNRYNPSEIEPKWQKIWNEDGRYKASDNSSKLKYYVSGMFPYPSGAGMHTGHFFEHSIVDAQARFMRAQGSNVMYPMGWDAFGLPAENYAIKTGTAPAISTKQNIANFTNQLKRVGASIDWSREITTSDPTYYKWTQWIFTEFYKRGLAYQKEANQWWCPVDKTVLANEQVESGKCWRCGSEVEKKSMKQWFFKITDYADALLKEIPGLDWPEKIKTAQTNWIGKSQGAEIDFSVEGLNDKLTVFTTWPDTIFGATFMVIAPEHPLISQLVNADTKAAVDEYVTNALKRSEIERQSDGKEKTGVFTGSYAVNPANGSKIPIWVADYVLGGYGTGAVMAVPAHDERDFEFAEKFGLPIVQVVAEHYLNEGIFAPKDNLETLEKEFVDAIITDGSGNYLLMTENEDNVHFVGGTVDESDNTIESAIRREIVEETGYFKVNDIKLAAPLRSFHAFRHTKDKNIKGITYYFEVVVDQDSERVKSEADTDRHSIEWVSREKVESMLTWESHRVSWRYYLENKTIDSDVSEGVLVNSGVFDGTPTSDAREQVVAWLEEQGVGRAKTTYKMRDWLISRQRYWGAPIPIIHCDEHGAVAVPEKDLPVLLPEVDDYEPKGESVLASQTDWVNTTCPKCGNPAKRETDTMDGYACSSWYLLRFADPNNGQKAWDPEKAKYWQPVDMYVGGDHAVAHLLYVRFWNHVFYDMKLVPNKEPVKKLVYHGYINAEDGRKMSKSLGNVVDPLEVIDAGYGADALRTFELFLGPINENSDWNSRGIAGVYRFLNRVWTLTHEYIESDTKSGGDENAELNVLRHKTVKKVTTDIHKLSFNTAIASLMEYVNELYKMKVGGFKGDWQSALEALVQCVQPFSPHVAAELWQQLGHQDQLDFVAWPTWDEDRLSTETVKVVVQVNGKMRTIIEIPKDSSEEFVKNEALKQEAVRRHIQKNSDQFKTVYIQNRLINIIGLM